MLETLNMESVIKKELITINSTAKTKEEILNELAIVLKNRNYISSITGFLDDVYIREKEGVTGIGDGVAIPHGKSNFVNSTVIAVATLKEEIKWESLDGDGINLLFLFAVKNGDEGNKHLLLLQNIAKKLAKENFIKKALLVKSKDEMYNLLCN